jgi:hypothetical protein
MVFTLTATLSCRVCLLSRVAEQVTPKLSHRQQNLCYLTLRGSGGWQLIWAVLARVSCEVLVTLTSSAVEGGFASRLLAGGPHHVDLSWGLS